MPLFPTKDEAACDCYDKFADSAEIDHNGHLYLYGKINSDNYIDNIFHHSSMCTCCDNHKIKPRKLIEKADTLNDNWWYPEKKKIFVLTVVIVAARIHVQLFIIFAYITF